jgi:hypothetical protein
VLEGIFGVDLSLLAACVAETALWLFVGDETASVSRPDQFLVGDALLGTTGEGMPWDRKALRRVEPDIAPLDFPESFPALFGNTAPEGFDWVVGNPPWVAFQGRATQKITPQRRAFYRAHYKAFVGYPTLHGLFVERAAQLAPHGHITLLLPSSVSDLDGYRSTRQTLRARHSPLEPLPEYGQDAFQGVVQPCFGLLAAPRDPSDMVFEASDGVWSLEERTHAAGSAFSVPMPEALGRVQQLLPLPPETFREVGFQSNRLVAAELFHRGPEPKEPFVVPLLEGRNVGEFIERAPGLFLFPDPDIFRQTKCRLKGSESYEAVDLVVRQTASFTIAARHGGLAFRNSLLGAFASADVDADLLAGLLNSALYRALHVARQRDARQAAFPQVKVSHLRKLPQPPLDQQVRAEIRRISVAASEAGGLNERARTELDGAVFRLFSLSADEAVSVCSFLQERAPAALRPSLFT